MSKPFWGSKTFWVNLFVFSGGLLSYITHSDFIAQYPQAAAIAVTILGAVNVILRFITNKPLATK